MCFWHDGDDAGAIKRAVKAREYVVSEERVGRNVVVTTETFSAEPWREEWWKTAELVTDALPHAKSVSGKNSRCAIMTTYVDDCDLDASKPLRTLVWKAVRTQSAAKDLLGVVREAWDSTSSCRGLRLTQGDYTAKILEDAVKLGFGPIRVCTTAGQSVTPPDPKLLPEQCGSSLEVYCSCHAARASTLALSLHDLPRKEKEGREEGKKGTKGTKGTQGNTGEHRGTQGNTGEHRGTQGNTGEHRGTQGNTGEHRGTKGTRGKRKEERKGKRDSPLLTQLIHVK